MHITKKSLSPTNVELQIAADQEQLDAAKERVLKELSKSVSLAGFRKGHAPSALVEKSVDQNILQKEVIDSLVNELFMAAIMQEKLKVVGQPAVDVTKFVPFSTLEVKIVAEVVGTIKLADYKKFKFSRSSEKVTKADVEAVMEDLLAREAEKTPVERAAKEGDEAVISFAGKDAKSGDPIPGGKGDNYPLIIGSNTFIPGFEPELVGMKKGDEKTFDITFPKDYGAKELQNKKVTFEVSILGVNEVSKPKADDAWAAKLGPFKNLQELKDDIERQVQTEKDSQADRALENEVLTALAEKSKIEIPSAIVSDEMDRMDQEERQNLMYRGTTWQEHLEQEGKTEEEHREGHREEATRRVKTGLALGEVAEAEGITVSEAEVNARMELLKAQYNDPKMQDELLKPEVRRDITSRVLTEKTIQKLVSYATN